MAPPRRRLAALLAGALALAALTAQARRALEPEAAAAGRVRDPSWLPSGRVVRAASFGQRLLLADLYWLKAVQYMGELVLTKGEGWAALHPLGDLVTDLDPRYGYVYQVVGSNLAGIAHRPAEADRILEKGERNLPDRWSLYWVHAVNKFLYEGDFKAAAALARRAAELSHRPSVALLAANLSLATDERDEYRLAEAVLQDAIVRADTDLLRADLEQRLVRVRTYDVLSRLEQAVTRYQRRFGAPPLTLGLLVLAGEINTVPPDPAGGVLLYQPLIAQVQSSVLGPRAPLRVR